MPKTELLTSRQAAERLEKDRSTISRWVAQGRLKVALRGTGVRGEQFFHPDDVDRLKSELEREMSA